MTLSIASLQEMGAFTGAPVEKEITWKQGKKTHKATVFVRPLAYHSAINDVLASRGKTDPVAGRIASSICDAEGGQVFTVTDITDGPLDPVELAKDPNSTKRLGALDGNLTVALLAVIGEVNSPGKQAS